MSSPVPQPQGSAESLLQPYYLRQRQDWAIHQERQRHIQALYQVGEWAAFFLMWTILDFQAGLVVRCTRCFSTSDSIEQRIANVYEQPTQNKCPVCYGTTFQGGIRARIVRPTIFVDADETNAQTAKGTMHPVNLTVESTTDFRMREGDYVARGDGTFYRCSTPQRTMLRTGFGHPDQPTTSISYNQAPAKLEDLTSVAYQLPATGLAGVLETNSRVPVDNSSWELLNGPLLPPGIVT